MLHVLAAFSAIDPAAAQPRVREFNRRFNDPSTGLGFTFSAAARDAAALRGAEELLEAQQIFDSYDAGYLYELAPDFDFATYFAKCPKPREAEALMKSWAAADPDAAFKAVAARFKTASPDDSLIGQAVSGCATLHGEPEAAKRASALLADLSPEHREFALRSFTRDVSPSRASAIVKALPNETDRTTFIQQVMAIGHRADGDATLAAFQALETEELQVRTLVEIVKSTPPQVRENPNSWTYQTKRIEGLMEKLGISEAGRERWRATLPP
jgi:hypothetical protein